MAESRSWIIKDVENGFIVTEGPCELGSAYREIKVYVFRNVAEIAEWIKGGGLKPL